MSFECDGPAVKPDFNIGDDDKMSDELYRIAEYIKSLCDKMKKSSDALFGKCQQYGFPAPPQPQSVDEIPPAPPQPFPGR